MTKEDQPSGFDEELFLTKIEGLIDGRFAQYQEHFNGLLENVKLDVLTTPTNDRRSNNATTADSDSDPVQLRLKQLEQKLAEYEQEKLANAEKERKARFMEKVGAVLDKDYPNVQFRSAVLAQLASGYDGSKEIEGGFLTKDGKPVSEAVKEWFQTDYGKHHLKVDSPPSSGMRPKTEEVLGTKSILSIQDKLAQGF